MCDSTPDGLHLAPYPWAGRQFIFARFTFALLGSLAPDSTARWLAQVIKISCNLLGVLSFFSLALPIGEQIVPFANCFAVNWASCWFAC